MDNYFILGDVAGQKGNVTRIAFGVLLDLDQVDPIQAAFKFGMVGNFGDFGSRLMLSVTSCP